MRAYVGDVSLQTVQGSQQCLEVAAAAGEDEPVGYELDWLGISHSNGYIRLAIDSAAGHPIWADGVVHDLKQGKFKWN